ncbi:flavin reductase family protein [Micromonospora pallida]|nr:flavin reductase family protein [Micromonospora pallida]
MTTPAPYRAGLPEPVAAVPTTDPTGVDSGTFRRAFRRHAAGVAVLTLAGPGGPVGVTVTSLASLSLTPPLLSFALATASSCWPSFQGAGSFVVNLLAAGQEDLAGRFATRGVDRFAAPTRWTRLPTGEPVLDDVPVSLRCTVEHRIPVGDHHLVVGRVLAVTTRAATAPLLYWDGAYTTVPEERRPDVDHG